MVLPSDPRRRVAALDGRSPPARAGPLVRAWREPAPLSATWRLTWWALGPLLFFTASIGKQPRYILPILPPLAVLLARGLAGYLRAARGPADGTRTLRLAGFLTGALLFTLAVLLYRAMPAASSYVEPWLVTLGAAMIGAAGVGLAAVSVAGAAAAIPLAVACAGALALAGLQYGLSPAGRDPVQDMAAHVAAHRADDRPVGTYRVFVRNLVFYTHAPSARPDDARTAAGVPRQPRARAVRDARARRRAAGTAGARSCACSPACAT